VAALTEEERSSLRDLLKKGEVKALSGIEFLLCRMLVR